MNTQRQSGWRDGKHASGLSLCKMYLTEEQLVKACIKKDRRAQKALVEKFGKGLHMVCRRYAPPKYSAEDILQDAFIKIFKNLHLFDPQRGCLEVWLRRITVNVALSRIRSIVNNISLETNPEKMPERPTSPSVYEDYDAEDILSLINALPELYRLVFNMAVVEGYSHDEIAETLSIASGTSRSYLTRARKLLKQQLEFIENSNYERRAV